MNTTLQTSRPDTRSLLSTLWIFVLLNMIFRDIHEIPMQEFLEEALQGTFNGMPITDIGMLVGGIMIETHIIMVVLSRVLPYAVNRWVNIIMGAVAIVLFALNNTAPDLDDVFFAIISMTTLASIFRIAWRWRERRT